MDEVQGPELIARISFSDVMLCMFFQVSMPSPQRSPAGPGIKLAEAIEQGRRGAVPGEE